MKQENHLAEYEDEGGSDFEGEFELTRSDRDVGLHQRSVREEIRIED